MSDPVPKFTPPGTPLDEEELAKGGAYTRPEILRAINRAPAKLREFLKAKVE